MNRDLEPASIFLGNKQAHFIPAAFLSFLWVAWPVNPGSQEKRNTEHVFQSALDVTHLIRMFVLQCQTTVYFKSLMNLCSHLCNFPILTLFRIDKDAYYKPQILLKGWTGKVLIVRRKPAIHLCAWLLISWQCYNAIQPLIAKPLGKDYKGSKDPNS